MLSNNEMPYMYRVKCAAENSYFHYLFSLTAIVNFCLTLDFII